MIIKNNGVVGIGTTIHQLHYLHVNGAATLASNGGGLKLIGSDHFYIEYYPDGYDSTGTTPVDKGRKGYIKYPGANDDKLTIHNNVAELVLSSGHGTKVTGTLSVGKAVTLASTLSVGDTVTITRSSSYDDQTWTETGGGTGKRPYPTMHIIDAIAGTPSDDEHTNLCIESRYTDDFTGSANNGMAGLSFIVNNNVNLDGTTTVGGSQYINEGQINYIAGPNGDRDGEEQGNLQFMVSDSTRTVSEVMRLCGGTSNVGIGTTNPSAKLHVRSSTYDSATDHTEHLLLLESNYVGDFATTAHAGGAGIKFKINDNNFGSSGEINYINENSDNNEKHGALQFKVSYDGTVSEAVRIRRDGNVGIGTTNPGSKLHIQDGTNYATHFNHGSNGDVYIRAGKTLEWC